MQRDPNRIGEILDLVGKTWQLNPDQRLLQLLLNVVRSPIPHPDIFSLEDNVLLDRLKYLSVNGSYPPPLDLPHKEELKCWVDGGSVQIKAVTGYDDPVDCGADEALEFAKQIVSAARSAAGA